jgi:hypothetical protein
LLSAGRRRKPTTGNDYCNGHDEYSTHSASPGQKW